MFSLYIKGASKWLIESINPGSRYESGVFKLKIEAIKFLRVLGFAIVIL